MVQNREEGRGISLVSLRRPLICRPTQTGRGSGLSTGIRFTGLASFCSPPVARCGSGRSSAGSSVQRVGRYPARPQVGSERSLWCHPSPELSVNSLRRGDLFMCLDALAGDISGSQWTRRWREVDSNPRSPVKKKPIYVVPKGTLLRVATRIGDGDLRGTFS